MDKLSRAELIALVQKIESAEGTEEEQDEWMRLLERNVPDPAVSDLIYWTFPELTPEGIVDRALAYRPIPLPGLTEELPSHGASGDPAVRRPRC